MKTYDLCKIILRWVAFLPLAFLSAYLAWVAVAFVNGLIIGLHPAIDSDSFLSRIFIDYTSQAIMGIAFVYVGTTIAPSYRKIVAYALGTLGIFLAGIAFFSAISINYYWGVWGVLAFMVGIVFGTFASVSMASEQGTFKHFFDS